MKKVVLVMSLLLTSGVFFTSCREESEVEQAADDMGDEMEEAGEEMEEEMDDM